MSPSTAHSTLFGRALATLPAAPIKTSCAFLPGRIRNKKEYDANPTPIVARPFPGGGGGSAFQFLPVSVGNDEDSTDAEDDVDDEREGTRRAALELMVSLSEARPALARRVDGWLPALVRACFEGVAELPESPSTLGDWLEADPADDPTDADYPHAFEQALDRLAVACTGKPVLALAFQYIPGMLASHDWCLRHGTLMAIATLGEGGARVMEVELVKVDGLVTHAFGDPHARVRFAACQCIGQLCTDLEEVIQAQHHAAIFDALLPTFRT
ncbi:armadillo-type protein [Phellopilus nigrolimitatus]|nr:armadillo-type protein [Phellopilus nigrolimitatus]